MNLLYCIPTEEEALAFEAEVRTVFGVDLEALAIVAPSDYSFLMDIFLSETAMLTFPDLKRAGRILGVRWSAVQTLVERARGPHRPAWVRVGRVQYRPPS